MNILTREEKLIKLLKDNKIYESFMDCFNIEQNMRKEYHLEYYKGLKHLVMKCNDYGQNEIKMAFYWDNYASVDFYALENIATKWEKLMKV